MLTDLEVVENLPGELRRMRNNANPFGRHLVMEGMLVAAPKDYIFDANAPHTYCRLCGAVFQTGADRRSVLDHSVRVEATATRKRWSHEHAATHTLSEHSALAASGRYMTAEAASQLIPLGIIPLTDMVFDPAVRQAAAEAPRLRPEVQDRMEEIANAVL